MSAKLNFSLVLAEGPGVSDSGLLVCPVMTCTVCRKPLSKLDMVMWKAHDPESIVAVCDRCDNGRFDAFDSIEVGEWLAYVQRNLGK